jgi:uncharacterized NAD(P)/FAD-binding protein YdhS
MARAVFWEFFATEGLAGAAEIMQIAIIGGGATGALAALHLARALSRRATEIFVVEPAEEVGRGLAYATEDPCHLLNVRVANMSAFPDQPNHLLEWLRSRCTLRDDADATPLCFIPRGTYGAYLADLVRELCASGTLRHVRTRCVDLVERVDKVVLTLETGAILGTEFVVLATGNDTKPDLSGIHAVKPWSRATLAELEGDGSVLIIGTGLTMVDQVLSLDRQGHDGKISALSPRGLLPSAHRHAKPFVLNKDIPFGAELSSIAAWIRSVAEETTFEGGDWRSAFDALRPHTQRLWRSMSYAQRRRFLRHARAYWDILRHRMAPEVEVRINALRAEGRLEIIAGRIVRAEKGKDGIAVKISRRGRKQTEDRKFARLIDCTGLADNPYRSDNPLIGALLVRGAARADPLRIGLDISEDYALIDRFSRSSDRIHAVGPLARATFWECTAIPDIRVQCQHVADIIAKKSSLYRRSA